MKTLSYTIKKLNQFYTRIEMLFYTTKKLNQSYTRMEILSYITKIKIAPHKNENTFSHLIILAGACATHVLS